MSYWKIGYYYVDHKKNLLARLEAISPYKRKSGSYLDFLYVGTDQYIRQNAANALSRFEIATAKNLNLGEELKKSQIETKPETSQIDMTNVIVVDFLLKKRIA